METATIKVIDWTTGKVREFESLYNAELWADCLKSIGHDAQIQ